MFINLKFLDLFKINQFNYNLIILINLKKNWTLIMYKMYIIFRPMYALCHTGFCEMFSKNWRNRVIDTY